MSIKSKRKTKSKQKAKTPSIELKVQNPDVAGIDIGGKFHPEASGSALFRGK